MTSKLKRTSQSKDFIISESAYSSNNSAKLFILISNISVNPFFNGDIWLILFNCIETV